MRMLAVQAGPIGMRDRAGGRRWGRRGSMLVETAMSAAMLIIAMGLTVKVLGWVGAERRAWDRRQWAVQEAANQMERISGRPFEAITPDAMAGLKVSDAAGQALPGAELRADVKENDPAGGAGSKRLAIQLRWKTRSGEWDAPVRLVSWIYRGRPAR